MNAITPAKKPSSRKNARRGQGMTEYIIIVALIAIASIGIVSLFGNNIRRLFGMAADAVAGEDSVAQANVAGASTNTAVTNKSMKTFGQNNGGY